MRKIAAFASTAGACAFVAAALPAMAHPNDGIRLNGPSLDGRKLGLPEGMAGAPALDDRRMALPSTTATE